MYIVAIFTISNPKTPSDIVLKKGKTSLNKGKQNQNARWRYNSCHCAYHRVRDIV